MKAVTRVGVGGPMGTGRQPPDPSYVTATAYPPPVATATGWPESPVSPSS